MFGELVLYWEWCDCVVCFDCLDDVVVCVVG